MPELTCREDACGCVKYFGSSAIAAPLAAGLPASDVQLPIKMASKCLTDSELYIPYM